MIRTEQLTDWIKETIEFYLFKMNSKYQLSDIELILDEEHIRSYQMNWDQMQNKTITEIKENNELCFNLDSDLETCTLAYLAHNHDDTQHWLWINIEFHPDLADLQKSIIHELVHLNFRKLKHGPEFDKLIDKYLHVGN